MEKVPIEWIDKIFNYMDTFFIEKWRNLVQGREDILKSIWQSGLIGLSKEEIKKGLSISKYLSSRNQTPPHVLEFYLYCKGIKTPPKLTKFVSDTKNPGIAKDSIRAMRSHLKGIHS